MPQLEVETRKNFKLGKYGSSFIDLYDPPIEKKKLVFTTQIIDPFFKDDPLICKPNLTKVSQRPLFAVERGNIPQWDCDIPEALQKEADFVMGKRQSKELDDFFKEQSNFNDVDIRDTNNFGGEFNTLDTIDKMEAVGGICFSLLDPNTRQFHPNGVKIHWSFGMGIDDVQDSCGGSGVASSGQGFDPPVILTDQRNSEGINIGNRQHQRWVYSNSRLYLEIRHGLNSDKYHASVTMNTEGLQGNWQQTPKNKSFILGRSTLRSNRRFGFFSGFNRFNGPFTDIPNGKITIMFFADPCDYTIENQSSLPDNQKYVGIS